MGYIVPVKSANVLVTEFTLDLHSIEGILRCVKKGIFHDLPPPAVKETLEGYYVLDGHHRLSIADLINEEINIYVARSSNDEMEHCHYPQFDSISLKVTNHQISMKYHMSKFDNEACSARGVSTIHELRTKYSFLESLEAAYKRFGI